MPSSDDGGDGKDGRFGRSRRRLLSALGAGGVGGAVLGYGAGATLGWGPLSDAGCDPTPLSSSPTEWPFPRYDRGNTGRVPARSAPDGSLRERWRVEFHRAYDVGQPVVANGMVFVQVASEYGTVRAFDLRDGSERWRVDYPDTDSAGPLVAAGDSVLSANLVEGRNVVALAAGDGSEQWRTTTDVGHFTPVVAGGRVFAAGPRYEGSGVATFDAASGRECWGTDLSGRAYGLPAFDAEHAFVSLRLTDGGEEPGVVALEQASGETVWETARGSEGFETPVVFGGRVFVPAFPARLYAFDAASGEELWRVASEHYLDGGVDDDGTRFARPSFEVGAVTEDAVVVALRVHSEYSDRLRAYDPASGDLLWEYVPESERETRFERPTVAGEAVYVPEYNRDADLRRILRLDVATGELLDAVELPDAGWRLVVADGVVLAVVDDWLVAFEGEG